MKITVSEDCGNAPKKSFLKDYLSAVAKGNTSFLTQHVEESITWEIVGSKSLDTKDQYLQAIQEHPLTDAQELVIETIITHGTDAAATGTFTISDGSKFAFCESYKFKGFKSAELKSIKSFLIRLPR